MIELKQFMLWILRRVFALPNQLLDFMAGTYNDNPWFLVLPIQIAIAFAVGIASGIITMALFAGHPPPGVVGIPVLIIWFTGGFAIISSGIRAMYRTFKQEQVDFIERLKQ